DIRDSLMDILNTKHHYIEVIEKNDFETRGLAIFSRYPIEKQEAVHFKGNKSYNSCVYADITVRGKTIRVFNLHLQSISFQPEDYRYLSKVRDNLEPDMRSSRRIGGRLKRPFMERAGQAQTVAQLIRGSPYPVIICGDFNDTPMSYAYQTIRREGLQSAYSQKVSGYPNTYAGPFPNYQKEHNMCDNNSVDVLNYHVIKENLTDHYPPNATPNLK